MTNQLALTRCSASFLTSLCPRVLRPQAERPSRKRRDSFGMLDGVEEERSSCSGESSGVSGASSPEDSEEEEELEGRMAPLAPSSSSSLTLAKTNGQVFARRDGKAGLGQSLPASSSPSSENGPIDARL